MTRFLWVSLFVISSASGQLFSVGVKGGVPFTGALSNATSNAVDVVSQTSSSSNEYIVGAMVELHLPLGLSVEADGLYRPLNLATQNQVIPQPTIYRTSENVSSWEFPIVGKYRFPIPLVKPYIEAGPSFRAVGSQLSVLSNKGFTVGAGVELRISKLRIGPEIRYTRWGSDGAPSIANVVTIASQTNQGEFLVGLSF